MRFIVVLYIFYVNLIEFYLIKRLMSHVIEEIENKSLLLQIKMQNEFYFELESKQTEVCMI